MIQSSNFQKLDTSRLLNFSFLVCLISIIPFLIFFFFTIPCSDDIFYHNYAQNKTTWEFLVNHYTTWTGRYFSNLMMAINPFTLTSNPNTYPAMMVSLFLLFFSSLFFFFRVLTKSFVSPSENLSYSRYGFHFAIITLAFFMHKMPRVADTFYWFAGTSSHLLPVCFILFSAGLYIRGLRLPAGSMRPLSVVVVSLTSIIVCGSNETLALQWLFILAFVLFYQKVISGRWEKVLFLPFLTAILSFLVLYFAPGNAVRAKELTGGHSITLMLYKPLGLTFETTFRYFSISLLVFILLFFPALKSLNKNLSEDLKSKKSRYFLYLFGFGLFGLTFVPSVWTMGSLPPHRVLNNTYLLFLIYGMFLILVSSHKMIFLERWSNKLSGRNLKFIFAVSLLVMFNNFFAWKDLFHLPSFLTSLKTRNLVVSSGQNTQMYLQPLAYFPRTFFYEDITTKAHDYRNVVFAEFYNLKGVALTRDYEQ